MLERITAIKKIIVFTVVFSIGIWFLYLINLIWVISVLIVLGIALGISGIPSQRIFPYHTAKPSIASLDIIKEKYARGEITKEEFDRMKEDLKD